MRAILLSLILLGCAGTQFTHPAKGEQAFRVDLTDCEAKFAAMPDRWAAGYAVDRCMESKGWAKK